MILSCISNQMVSSSRNCSVVVGFMALFLLVGILTSHTTMQVFDCAVVGALFALGFSVGIATTDAINFSCYPAEAENKWYRGFFIKYWTSDIMTDFSNSVTCITIVLLLTSLCV